MLAPALRQSSELFRKLLACYEAAGRPVPAQAESQLRLELTNGTRPRSISFSIGAKLQSVATILRIMVGRALYPAYSSLLNSEP